MLSLHQAIEIKESIIAYLKATFTFQDKRVHKAFYEFINHPTEGMFKGPYLSLKLRFVKANQGDIDRIPLEIKPSWRPYDHQVKSWHRLSTQDKEPEPTIVTTGTGSGKTESFIYPVLDYCYKNLHRPGIKVIILYPMNALATDQAKRLAEAIHEDERLKGKVTAGLFIGEGKNITKYPKDMGPTNITENKEAILSSPPDILLTNFKMLDYGLMKSNYHDLWTFNLQDPDLFRFLILDELHTYDGAQGTDVANLIRRLKLKLNVAPGQLCPVGTSATIGSGEQALRLLAEYATKIFGEHIAEDAIITENRISPSEFFGDDKALDVFLPRTQKLRETQLTNNEDFGAFIKRQISIWQLDENDLANGLRKQLIVKDLVTVCAEGKGIATLEELERGLSQINPAFRNVPQWDEEHQFSPKTALIESLFALIAEARDADGQRAPFLYAQTQLWIRELSGVQRVFADEPRFVWKDHVEEEEEGKALPPWFCRECGASGWLGVKHDNKSRFEEEREDVYDKFFSNHKNLYFINPVESLDIPDFVDTGYDPTDVLKGFVHRKTLVIENQPDRGRVHVLATRKLNSYNRADHICPCCNTKNSVSIIGTKIATLSSIAVSQTLATDLDPQSEKNRKVLAFTNSVQDAAHQAGFVEARNYRFTFRASIQKVLNQVGGSIPLTQLAEQFITYWKQHADESGKDPLDAYYYRFYPKDYLGKSSPPDYKENGRYDGAFIKEFDQRMLWEIYAEFGYDSLIGRTLEKTGSSGVYFDRVAMSRVWDEMKVWLASNEMSGTIDEEGFSRFLFLILHRIRSRGAIAHPFLDKYRKGSLQLRDLNWLNDTRHFLNRKFGPQSRLPRLITTHAETRSGLLDTTYTQKTNWFHAYYKKSFPLATNHNDMVNEFFGELIATLLKHGVLDEDAAGDTKNYAIDPNSIWVANITRELECDQCGHVLQSADETDQGVGGKCLNYRCSGTYQSTHTTYNQNYYHAVYNRNRSPRIYAAEHTGLLERKAREILEKDFKDHPEFNSKNALVATSTLEMGIDIGTLNAAYNNSVPPLPSNFLQRVGRAGRASGNALIINFVKSQAHDLFYFQEPLDMMAGEVSTPGCFLEAKEILRRHFFAFCIDTWTSQGPKLHVIPSMIRFMRLETQDLQGVEFFLNRILNFVRANEMKLFSAFREQYAGDVRPEVFEELKRIMENEKFYDFYKAIFERLKHEMLFINAKRKEIKDRIATLKLSEKDPIRIEMEAESKSLGGIISSIRKRNTLEHLTNSGALPNYAFPETGVSLAASVIGSKATGSLREPLSRDYEIVRSANQAIREFAPDNYFYTQGYRFQITGVNTFDWANKGSNFHLKRFCSQCDHIEKDSLAEKGNCPKCGHESWNASSNVRSFAKLTSVKSFNNQASAVLDDNSDDRELITYNNMSHLHFDQKTSLGAWALKDIPFGIEFVKHVSIHTTNLGRTDVIDARRIVINGEEVAAKGFVTCKYCGKSSSNVVANNYKFHYGYCKHREQPYAGKSDEVFEEVFFFREIETEALKVLLPVQDFNSEAEIKMFKAGIQLGLKKFYRGNPQHIDIAEYKEFNRKTLRFDRYLVLFDRVPGGTGYLEQLFDRDEFSKLLNEAYIAIRDCTCQNEGKDGCYRCIFSYGNQFYQNDLSRKRAEKWFQNIVSKTEDWEKQVSGLADAVSIGQIEESELEDRFIRSLRKLPTLDSSWVFKEVNDDGTVNYTLSYKKGLAEVAYHIRPQINLGPSDGIEYHTRTDFLFTCTSAQLNGIDMREEIRKVAIYLDGYQYHASEAHNRFENDFTKRQAINANNQFTTWTLTWDDMERFDEGFKDAQDQKNRKDFLAKKLSEEGFKQTKKALLGAVKTEKLDIFDCQNNFERLLEKLKYPFRNAAAYNASWSLYMALFQREFAKPSYDPNRSEDAFRREWDDTYCLTKRTLDGLVVFQGIEPNKLFDLRTLINIQQRQVFSKMIFHDTTDILKEDWDRFWTLYNLLQEFEFEKVMAFASLVGSISKSAPDFEEEFIEILNWFEPHYRTILISMFRKGLIASSDDEVGLNSLLGADNKIIAEAGLIIQHLRIAIEPASAQDGEMFVKEGFKVLTRSQLEEVVI